MSLEKLSFQHQQLLQKRLKKSGTFLSEYSFPNLYLFRGFHDYYVLKDQDDIFISGKTEDGQRFLMPTTAIKPMDLPKLTALSRAYDFIFPVPEEWLSAFPAEQVQVRYHDKESDYIYSVVKLSTYKGQKLHNKKNLLNQFLAHYAHTAQPLTKERMKDALEILEAWAAEVGADKEETDYNPCREACLLYDELILCGGIYYVDQEPAGFVIGEELNEQMFVLHFAKGKRKFKGLYQFMFNHFANILPNKYQYLNFEQDMGKQALKLAKSSYDPDRLLRKYRVHFGNGSRD